MAPENPSTGDLPLDRRLTAAHVGLGRAVRQLRQAAGISQDALAARCDLHRTYVGGIERGERNVSFGNLVKLAGALGVRPSELLARAEALAASVPGRTRPV
ncbi:MAG TPA: helix-turn-helix transcriptional regulator [Solirubrobacteraceae bacterium]